MDDVIGLLLAPCYQQDFDEDCNLIKNLGLVQGQFFPAASRLKVGYIRSTALLGSEVAIGIIIIESTYVNDVNLLQELVCDLLVCFSQQRGMCAQGLP